MSATTEHQIAWELADALNQHLTVEDRAVVYMYLGSAHHSAAIRRLLHVALRAQVGLSASILDQLQVWCRVCRREDDFAPLLARLRQPTSSRGLPRPGGVSRGMP